MKLHAITTSKPAADQAAEINERIAAAMAEETAKFAELNAINVRESENTRRRLGLEKTGAGSASTEQVIADLVAGRTAETSNFIEMRKLLREHAGFDGERRKLGRELGDIQAKIGALVLVRDAAAWDEAVRATAQALLALRSANRRRWALQQKIEADSRMGAGLGLRLAWNNGEVFDPDLFGSGSDYLLECVRHGLLSRRDIEER